MRVLLTKNKDVLFLNSEEIVYVNRGFLSETFVSTTLLTWRCHDTIIVYQLLRSIVKIKKQVDLDSGVIIQSVMRIRCPFALHCSYLLLIIEKVDVAFIVEVGLYHLWTSDVPDLDWVKRVVGVTDELPWLEH